MKRKLEEIPNWSAKALQGLTHWIGHRRCLFSNYPLAEAAFVAEICNLIHANLKGNLMLECEVQYTKLLNGQARPSALTERARADLVVSEVAKTKGGTPTPRFVIEVKRATSPKAQIDGDLKRLAAVRGKHRDLRAFLFVVAEAHRPKRFVTSDGASLRGNCVIPGSKGHYRVRRTWKAAHAFTKKESAQYACLLEVFPDTP